MVYQRVAVSISIGSPLTVSCSTCITQKGSTFSRLFFESRECYARQRPGHVEEQLQQSFHRAVAQSLPLVSTPQLELPIVGLSWRPMECNRSFQPQFRTIARVVDACVRVVAQGCRFAIRQ